jgi:class 3 adenylate cyclase
MFVDMVGSTALSGRLDPEEMGEVLAAYQDAVSAEVARLGGHVAKFMGDGVLAYFGWPRAYEDAAERAVRAGLAAAAAVGRLRTGGGEALAGPGRHRHGPRRRRPPRRAGHGPGGGVVRVRRPTSPHGCKSWPGPGAVVVAEGTRRLLGGLFELEDLGSHPSRASPARSRPGGWRARAGPRAASRRCTPRA